MSAITLRNLPPEILRRVRERAARKRISLNRAVIELLEEGLQVGPRRPGSVKHHDLDDFFGTWSRAEAAAFNAALAEQRQIDHELWS